MILLRALAGVSPATGPIWRGETCRLPFRDSRQDARSQQARWLCPASPRFKKRKKSLSSDKQSINLEELHTDKYKKC